MSAEDIALAHQRERAGLAAIAEEAAAQAWARVDPDLIYATWAQQLPNLTAVVTAAQTQAAATADDYLDAVLGAQNLDTAAAGRIDPRSFAGIASDGRALESLLQQPAITALQAIQGGASVDRAMASGLASARMIASTQVADAGRAADSAAMAARPSASGYIRVVVGRTCSRCTVLAGKYYAWNAGFDRHPKCDCIHLPTVEAKAAGLIRKPREVFDGLSRAEQDRAYGKAGAAAIRDGADPAQVVNARRGMYVAGGEQLTRTSAGRTRRLMPEQIYRQAADRDEAVRLLRQNGYLVQPAVPKARPFAERVEAAASGLDAVPVRIGEERGTRRLEWAGAGDPPWDAAQQKEMLDALMAYRGSGYRAINGLLRGTLSPSWPASAREEAVRHAGVLDEVMSHSRLSREVLVWRGSKSGRGVFGDRLSGDLTGFEWVEEAYVSTSAVEEFAVEFATDLVPLKERTTGLVMRRITPKGTAAVQLSASEAELLLHRGTRMRVVADHGVHPGGYRLIDVEVMP